MPIWLSSTFSVAVGGVLTMLSAWIMDIRLTAREREKRAAERRERLCDRRNEFQHETLLALQVATQKLLRTAGAMNHQDIMAVIFKAYSHL